MMTARISIVFASMMILSACNAPHQTGPNTVDPAKINAEVVAAAHAHIAAFNAHDAEKAVSADLPDVVVMFHGAPNDVGVPADLATTKAEVADPLAHVELSAETVDVGGADFAVYHSTYDYTLTDPKTKAPTHERGNFLIAYKRQPDGALKIAWEIISDVPAPK
jgi:ketosteroid isomerase-like protein